GSRGNGSDGPGGGSPRPGPPGFGRGGEGGTVHPRAVGRIERDEVHAQKNFALLGLERRAFAHTKMLRAELCLRPRDENYLPVLHTPLPCFVAATFLPRSSDDGRPFRAVHALAWP